MINTHTCNNQRYNAHSNNDKDLTTIQQIQAYAELLVCDLNGEDWYYASEFILHKLSIYSPKEVVKELSGICLLQNTSISEKSQNPDYPFNAVIHHHKSYLVIEFEDNHFDIPNEIDLTRLKNLLSSNNTKKSFSGFLNEVCKEISTELDYDHVMIYEFDDDYNGNVIVEQKKNDLPSYLGLKFPNEYVPKEVRELYGENKFQLKYETKTGSNPVFANHSISAKPSLDLSSCYISRSSENHFDFLDQIGVESSFSIAIMHLHRLWGFMICNSSTPKFANEQIRTTLTEISDVISANLGLLYEYNNEMLKSNNGISMKILDESLVNSNDLIDALIYDENAIFNLIQSDGVILKTGNSIMTRGEVAPFEKIEQLIDWFSLDNPFNIKTINNGKDQLSEEFYCSCFAGVLVLQLSYTAGDYLIWTRKEESYNVTWAGNRIAIDNLDHTSNSILENWNELVEGRSLPWESSDTEFAIQLKNEIRNFIYLRFNEMKTMNRELIESIDSIALIHEQFDSDKSFLVTSMKKFTQSFKDDFSLVLEKHGVSLLDFVEDQITILKEYSFKLNQVRNTNNTFGSNLNRQKQ